MPLNDNTPKERNTPHTRPEVEAEKPATQAAHQQADEDIKHDADLTSAPSPADDLDEGELARYENNDPIVPLPADDGE